METYHDEQENADHDADSGANEANSSLQALCLKDDALRRFPQHGKETGRAVTSLSTSKRLDPKSVPVQRRPIDSLNPPDVVMSSAVEA